MRVMERREVTSVTEIGVGITCDKCGREIRNKENISRRNWLFPYYVVTTSHHDWGNDSIDSYKYFDFCSAECLSSHMNDYYDSANGSECYEIERTF